MPCGELGAPVDEDDAYDELCTVDTNLSVTSRARAADASIVKRFGVDVVLNVERCDHTQATIDMYDCTDTLYWHLPLDDSNDPDSCTELLHVCRRAWDIVRVLPDTFHVLVHCRMGISRSVAVTCYIMMQRHPTMTYAQALARTQEKRSCAWPNDGFARVLTALRQ